jgi:hypothetical protein
LTGALAWASNRLPLVRMGRGIGLDVICVVCHHACSLKPQKAVFFCGLAAYYVLCKRK